MQVVCTAGHVDHGKSTLVRALTGIEPDRLAEERRRGLTIDIGYAWTDLGGITIAFVDLPGHERFIANMLAGAGAVRLALFVVAADEGWMPQSAEHLAVLDLLGIDGGVVAVTRADLVDAETLELAVELVREELTGSVLDGASVVPVSAVTGVGMDAVRSALTRLVDRAPAAAAGDRARLWVDRSFSVAGAGTVVTGTLTGGLSAGDTVEFGPVGPHGGRETARIRGLQQLNEPVGRATAGRVAVSLTGVDPDAVGRGSAVTRGPWQRTTVLDAWVRSLGGRAVRRKGSWHLHVGAAERVVTVRPLSGDIGAEGGYCRLTFEGALPLRPGDRFVLREAGARETVGGGAVLDVDPGPPQRGRASRAARVAQLTARRSAVERGPGALTAAVVREQRVIDGEALARAVGAGAVVPGPHDGGPLVRMGGLVADRAGLDGITQATVDTVAAHHATAPLSPGAPRPACRLAMIVAGCPEVHADAVLDHLVAAGTLVAEGQLLRLPGHRVRLDAAARLQRQCLLDRLDATPFAPPGVDVAAAACGADGPLLRALEHLGELVRLNDQVTMTGAAIAEAERRLRALHARHGAFTAADARAELGTTRRYVIPLLEELDRRGVTRRVGDRREVS